MADLSDLNPAHIPVLPDEVIEALQPAPGGVYVDCTAGLGGHAAMIARHITPGGVIVLNDLDQNNLESAKSLVGKSLGGGEKLLGVRGNFSDLPRTLKAEGIRADMVLADLGFASSQVDDPERGLSFRFSGPLDMRLDRDSVVTAAELVNTLPEHELVRILRDFGEEKHARRIASKLVAEREVVPITTTDRLADIVRSAVPGPRRSIHPATKTFQALRIAVNDELGSLEALLRVIGIALGKLAKGEQTWLRPGARIAFIAFHSLEDRPVKRAMSGWAADALVHNCTRKPIEASEGELATNPRSRSAKMRVCTAGAGTPG
ncbi:MAG: 16S rRNA (cytosine(1402)-N(4))-methyltransferase RsmH [Phycisphaerales bacterium]|nr:16S rRNA (cytosine(1402)-N(4))-methyltransferase RsmH [Phycisphaerales bacterium]